MYSPTWRSPCRARSRCVCSANSASDVLSCQLYTMLLKWYGTYSSRVAQPMCIRIRDDLACSWIAGLVFRFITPVPIFVVASPILKPVGVHCRKYQLPSDRNRRVAQYVDQGRICRGTHLGRRNSRGRIDYGPRGCIPCQDIALRRSILMRRGWLLTRRQVRAHKNSLVFGACVGTGIPYEWHPWKVVTNCMWRQDIAANIPRVPTRPPASPRIFAFETRAVEHATSPRAVWHCVRVPDETTHDPKSLHQATH